MVFVADDLGAWLVGLVADAGRKRLTAVVLGSEQERALRRAATTAVRLTAQELCPEDDEQAEQLTMVVSEVFSAPVMDPATARQATLLVTLQAGIAWQLAPLDDPSLTGIGRSSLALLDVSAAVLAKKLTGHLVREIIVRGARGGPLVPLAAQLNHDVSYQQGQRIEEIVGRLDNEVRKAMARLEAPRAVAVPAGPAQLPPSLSGFTGRDADLARLTGLLDPAGTAGAIPVLVVAGLAGVGKTTLAVEAGHAARRHGWFAGGVLFLDLHGYDERRLEAAGALEALLRALGVPVERVPPSVEERAGLYRSVLADIPEPVLVIADNASSEAQVRQLLPGAEPHKVLVTSRHILGGLDARLLEVPVLDDAAGVELLDRALLAARPDDERISGDRDAARQVAGACGGLPLALQIAAALLKADPARGVGELAEELVIESARLEQLRYDDGSGAAGLSVAAAFELSYCKLEEIPARVFRLLPVNPGPDVSTEAAAVLADLPVRHVRRALAELARAHLIESAPVGKGRWRMHDLLRLYALRLSGDHAEADDREQARDRLLDHYVRRALAAAPALFAGSASGRAAALDWLDAERPCLVAAVEMAAYTGRDRVAVILPVALGDYLLWRWRLDDLLAVTAISLNTARGYGHRAAEGMVLDVFGTALTQARRFEEAVKAHQEAAEILRESGNQRGEGKVLDNLAMALRELKRFDEAIEAHERSRAISRQAGDRQDEVKALANLGNTLRAAGRSDEAIRALRSAAEIFRKVGDRAGEGGALTSLGLALQEMGLLDEAISVHQQALTINREVGNRHSEAMVLNNLGISLHQAHRFDEAIAAYQDAAAIYLESGDRHRRATTLTNLGSALHEAGRLNDAVAAYQDAAGIFRETGDVQRETAALGKLEDFQRRQP
jgi:tetratricopeptide (TPR) repeat protein